MMKKYSLLILFIAVLFTSCTKELSTTNEDPIITSETTLEELNIPIDFDWKTTKTLEVQLLLPESAGLARTKITSVDGSKLYFKGYPSDTTQKALNTKITVPAYLEVLKVSNGMTESFVDIQGNTLYHDFNNMDKSANSSNDVCGECDGQITQLTLQYLGSESSPLIKVTQKKGGNHNFVIFEDNVSGDFGFVGANNHNKMGAKIKIYVNGEENVEIHTSCSITILAGMTFGDFLIVAGESDNGGPLCEVEEEEQESFSGTVIYEDLYPAKGDYDFNDLVVEYNYEIHKGDNNYVTDIEAVFTVKAFGASFHNAFGFQFPSIVPSDVLSVTGSVFKPSTIFNMASNGIEAAQTKATFIVYDDAFDIMSHPGSGIGVNTTPGSDYVEPVSVTINITFVANSVSFNDLDIGNFNPFIVMKQDRGYEVHLAGYEPTDLFDSNLFGVYDDDSNAGIARYFLTENNLPWAINIPDGFDYMNEKARINTGYLMFTTWAQSGGVSYPDWFVNEPGYRNEANIYQIP
ncbi:MULTISPECIES: LruC domain-containing protein [unclassified Lentimicrobium]|uniref:LruC domain-containing protein n=1 Tax=unclassified Lentimicrobium TaxID=2677434 RepID=UPI0015568E8C|nr:MULTISPECIES: LruC domain-containing protein [unclassified Lentimicrobium]NPD44279.1 LruC domain-containing protein [Lentimicrobium sp. S6]NPD86177.1 LruC domain-containing protein [Lentimicrobium sp. L6]